MSVPTLTRLKDELLELYGEDQIGVLATTAAIRQVDELLKGGKTKLNNRLSFGKGDPNKPAAVADYSVTFAELLARFDPASGQAKAARARLIVFAYTLWENIYRPAIRRECGMDRIESDSFGDLRRYRHAILHRNGKLDTDTKSLTVFRKSDLIDPTADQLREVFKQLVVALNEIGIRYYGEDPGFEWGRRLNS
jgi:hypothetical protein